MPAILDFDRFFLTFPPLAKEPDFDRFWKDSVAGCKKVAIDASSKTNSSKSSARFDVSDIAFTSTGKVKIHALLYMPKNTEKPHPVIIAHDYNSPDPYKGFGLDEHYAYLFIRLRGHENLSRTASHHAKDAENEGSQKTDNELPGYFQEGIGNASTYYAKGVYCDLLRSIDLLRLNRKLDCSSLGIIGKGIGAAAALFCASQSDRVTALVLDSPAFVYLEEWNNKSEGDISSEITGYIHSHQSQRAAVKKTLSYFDALNFSEDVRCDTLMSIGLRDAIAPPQCSLALFNHLLCDKTMEVYPDDGNDAGGEKQFRKSLAWLRKRLKN